MWSNVAEPAMLQERLDKVNKLPRREDNGRPTEDLQAVDGRRASRRGLLGVFTPVSPAPASALASETPSTSHPSPAASNSFRSRRAGSTGVIPERVPEQEVVAPGVPIAKADSDWPGSTDRHTDVEEVSEQRGARGNWSYVLNVMRAVLGFKEAGRQRSKQSQ